MKTWNSNSLVEYGFDNTIFLLYTFRSKTHCIQKPMEESDFRKIEEELQMKLSEATTFPTKGLSNLGWANTCIGMYQVH